MAHDTGAVDRGGFMSQHLDEQLLPFFQVLTKIVVLCLLDAIKEVRRYFQVVPHLPRMSWSFGVWIRWLLMFIISLECIRGPSTLFWWGGSSGFCLWCLGYLNRDVDQPWPSASLASGCFKNASLGGRARLSELPHDEGMSCSRQVTTYDAETIRLYIEIHCNTTRLIHVYPQNSTYLTCANCHWMMIMEYYLHSFRQFRYLRYEHVTVKMHIFRDVLTNIKRPSLFTDSGHADVWKVLTNIHMVSICPVNFIVDIWFVKHRQIYI